MPSVYKVLTSISQIVMIFGVYVYFGKKKQNVSSFKSMGSMGSVLLHPKLGLNHLTLKHFEAVSSVLIVGFS